jgi:thiol-disulfide isomerase/thioredoxin/outer membrane lipoprotein-sorting protein
MFRPHALAAACIVCAAGFAHAQVDEAAKQKFQQMADTIRDAKALSYRVEFAGAGGFFAMVPGVKCDVTLKRQPDHPGTWLSRIEGRREATEAAGGAPAVEILIVGDGSTRTWVDVPAKKVIERSESQVGNADVILAASMGNVREVMDANAMAKELNAPNIKSEGSETIDGVACDVVTVDQGTQQYSTRWAIAQSDHLPRKITRAYPGVGTQVWNVSSVKLNPDVPDTLFKITTPEGYATTVKPAGPQPPTTGVELGNLAPDFELTDLKGQKVRLSELRGHVVVLSFWGTWCLPCKKVGPELQRLSEAYKDKPVKVFAMDIRESSDDKPADYMNENKFTYGVLLKADDVAKTYKVKVPPAYFVIGKEGQIAHVATGYEETRTFAGITQAIELALAGQGPTTTTPPPPKPTGDDAGAGGSSDK